MNPQIQNRIKRGFINPNTGLVFDRYFYKKGVVRESWKAPDVFAKQKAEIARKSKISRANNKERRAATWKAWYSKNRSEKRAYDNKYKAENKIALRAKRVAWTALDPEHVRRINRISKKKNKAQALEYQRMRYKTDPNFRISRLMRCALWRMAKFGWKKKAKCAEYIGCSFAELRAHLESKFQEGMSWDNHGQWEIDHKTPLSWFNLSDEEQVKKAWHYTNLQPLWRHANRTKLNRFAA